ncbi:MAG: head GIN domain-containing protein [Bacteroidota bacterium]
MKNKIYYLIVLGMITIFFASCNQADYLPCVKPSGEVVEELRATEPFTGISLYSHAKVYIVQGSENSVRVEAAPNIQDHIEVYTSGNTLYIDNTRCLRTRADEVKIFIATPTITSVGLSGSGYVYLEEGFTGEHLHLALSGSGKLSAEPVHFQEIEIGLSGSGNITVKGTVQKEAIAISGSGNVNGSLLESEQAFVKITGSGNAKVFVNEFLDARIAGSGNIWYWGSPEINMNIAGSGAIHYAGHDDVAE